MSLRAIFLGASAILLMGSGGYLYHAVHENPPEVGTPHPARVSHVEPPPEPTPPVVADTAKPVASPYHAPAHHDQTPPPPVEPTPDPGSGSGSDGQIANPKADQLMDRANKAYDNGDFDEAAQMAAKVLTTDPTNIRMMRIMVSSGCQTGDIPTAQKYYSLLGVNDRTQMRIRCGRYGIVLQEPT